MKRIVLFLLGLYLYLDIGVCGWIMPTDAKIEMRLKHLNKPAIKTILGKGGKTIDCVDIYKQPALDHPLLKNHTIELKPSFYPLLPNSTTEVKKQFSETCPKGTIPIRRISKEELIRRIQYGDLGFDLDVNVNPPLPEYAEATSYPEGMGQPGVSPWSGVSGFVNIWKPSVLSDESSFTGVGLIHMYDRDKWIKAGYLASPLIFGDNEPHIVISMKYDKNHGACINLECQGFVQINRDVTLGEVFIEKSAYGGNQLDAPFSIYKDNVQQKWWVGARGFIVGYFPFSVLETGFEEKVIAQWGGMVMNGWPLGVHTTTSMGSGRLPPEGYKKAAYIRTMLVLTRDLKLVPPTNLHFFSTHEHCYSVVRGEEQGSPMPGALVHIYLGGPGGAGCDWMAR